MTNDKQIEDSIIADAMEEYKRTSPLGYAVSLQEMYDEGYKTAIAATHEQYKPLVEALEYYARNHHHLPTNAPNFAHEALANLPEERKRW